ncbi:MAG: glycosyltransferase [Pseudoxanthomonas suwonensis]|nr:glycosyltransferase [Pseudoxanthomonas suwonensis]
MRLLVIAYEFPPSPSPQSLRWAYLCRELAARGHEVHVLTIDLGPDNPGLPALPPEVCIHRTWPGPLRGITAWSRKRNIARVQAARAAQANSSTGAASNASSAATAEPGSTAPQVAPPIAAVADGVGERLPFEMPKPTRLGAVKAFIWSVLLRIGEYTVFPDIRGEWLWPARKRLRQLLREHAFDAVISSHEPATTLQLGLLAQARGIAFVADLGDPVLAGYTPPRWRGRALRLEAEVARKAALVTVTADSAAVLLRERHRTLAPVHVITQGFVATPPAPLDIGTLFDPARLELLYTGSFYAFRRPEALLDAVLATPGARLNVATVQAPDVLKRMAAAHPDAIRLLGFLPHLRALQLQRRADVLVNIANADNTQIPGKLYEYAGACRPILHITPQPDQDPSADWIRAHERGWVSADDQQTLAAHIRRAAADKREGRLGSGLDLSAGRVAAFSWERGADTLDTLLQNLGRDAQPTAST